LIKTATYGRVGVLRLVKRFADNSLNLGESVKEPDEKLPSIKIGRIIEEFCLKDSCSLAWLSGNRVKLWCMKYWKSRF
jgi:hypothetical protein